jgi:hypothetical protein
MHGDTIHVLVGSDGLEGLPFVDMGGDRVLEEDAVDGRIATEVFDDLDELGGGGPRRQPDEP